MRTFLLFLVVMQFFPAYQNSKNVKKYIFRLKNADLQKYQLTFCVFFKGLKLFMHTTI